LGEGVWLSEDGGNSWTQIGSPFNGLLVPQVYALAFDGPGLLIAGTAEGVYAYDAGSGNWSVLGTGSEAYEIRSLVVAGGNLYAGTWGEGILRYNRGLATCITAFAWRAGEEPLLVAGTAGAGFLLLQSLETTATEKEELPTTFSLAPVPRPEKVKLVLYDVLGREVQVLRDALMDAGWHTLTVEGKGLASGVYFLRLQVGKQVKVQKLVRVQ